MWVIDWKRTPGSPIECSRRWSNSRRAGADAGSIERPPRRDRWALRSSQTAGTPPNGSMTEVSSTRQNHGRPRRGDGFDDLAVALRAAGLDDRRDAGVERELRAVREREERVARERRAAEVVPVLARLLDGDAHRVDAAHLPGADADRLQILGDHDRVRGDVLADAPGEEH